MFIEIGLGWLGLMAPDLLLVQWLRSPIPIAGIPIQPLYMATGFPVIVEEYLNGIRGDPEGGIPNLARYGGILLTQYTQLRFH